MIYAGFWKRFVAGWVDFFVLLPVILLDVWVSSLSRPITVLLALPLALSYVLYNVYFHARTGQTIGKRATGIRVVNVDGSRIGRRTACLRSSVDFGFALISGVGVIWGILALSGTEFASLGWTNRQLRISEMQPPVFFWVDYAAFVWVWSELVVLLFNAKKRALHDFIAGTVVIVDPVSRAEGVSPAGSPAAPRGERY